MSDNRNRDGMDELRELGGEEYGDTGGQSDGDGSGKATGRKRRVIVGALIAIFAAGMVFAGWNVIGAAMANNRRAHAAALADCRSARTDYIRTYTSYTPAMSKAATLLKETKSITDSDTRDRLQQQVDSLRGSGVEELAAKECSAKQSRGELSDLADSYGRSRTVMVNGLTTVQYDSQTLQQMIDGMNAQDMRKQLSKLISRGELALERSKGKADESKRSTLETGLASAKHTLDTASSDDVTALNGEFARLKAIIDGIIASMPLDCHFTQCVALTFDDGPNKTNTPKVLDVLKNAGVPATFFLQGQFVNGSNVGLVRRMTGEGHDVGSISWRHTQMHGMPAEQLRKWFDDTDAVISKASGKDVTLFRPPDGAWGDALRAQARDSGQAMILWGVDSGDWGKLGADAITKRVVDGAYSGSIVSLHDGNAATAKALPKIIKGLKGKGYALVTVNTLFAGDIRPGDVAYGLNDVQRDAE